MTLPVLNPNNCPIRQHTADGVNVGRCYHYVGEVAPHVCPLHGDVTEVVKHYRETGKLTNDKFAKVR